MRMNMNIRNKNKKLTITLGTECVIADVETELRKLRKAFSKEIEKIEIKAKSVEEIDTAYFQLLLSVEQTAAQQQIPLIFSDISPELQNICELYGINLL